MKYFTLKAKAVLCMLLTLMGVHAYAQETITVGGGNPIPVVSVQTVNVEDAAGNAYADLRAEFSVATVTEALGIESITDAAKYIVNPTTWEAVENSTDGWRNGEGDLCGWGDITEESRGYCVKIDEPATGAINYLGAHHNGVWNEGETFTAYWGFVAGEKAALVKVVVTFGPALEEPEPEEPAVELPEAETTIANLQIVGSVEVSNERYYTQGYETSDLAVVIPNLAEALGISKGDLAQVFSQMIYVDQYNEGTNTGVLNYLTVTDGWMRTFLDSETEEQTGEMVGAGYSGDCDVYVQQMAYNAETDEVTFVMGQMPGGLELGDVRFVSLYVVYGQKAFVIKYRVSFVEPPFQGLEERVKVGEQTINLSQQPTNDYSFVSFSIDLEAIAALLGAEDVTDVQMQALDAKGGLSNDHTANNGGWWLTAEGIVTSWGSSSAFFVEPTANNTWTEFHAGQFPDASKGGDTFTGKFYLTFGANYYELTVNFTVTEKEDVVDPDELHVVAERTITIQQEQNDAYAWSEGVGIPVEYLVETIGTAAPYLYALSKESTEEKAVYTDEYTCDPKPGYWLTADGKQTTWSDGASTWGISVAVRAADDALFFNAIQFPGRTQVGNQLTGSFFLANPEDGSMLQVNVIYKIVNQVVTSEVIGEQNLVVKVSDDECHASVALAEIAELLGYESVDELLGAECLRAKNSDGVYDELHQPSNGITVDEEGYVAEDEAVGLYFDEGMLYTYCNADEAPANWKANVELSFEKDGKSYLLHLTLVSADIYDEYVGIKSLGSDAQTVCYDLQGRKAVGAQKGIYIQNGVKIVK